MGHDILKYMSSGDDCFINTGFQLETRPNSNPDFIGADDLFTVSGYQDFWLKGYYDYVSSDHAVIPFFGPAICISRMYPMRYLNNLRVFCRFTDLTQ